MLHYHGDFDWPGVAIAGRIFRNFAAQPWRFDEAAYISIWDRKGRPLDGAAARTPWSPSLASAMELNRRAYDEEAIADILLADLESG